MMDRLTRGLDMYFLALDLDGAAVDRICAENRAHDLGTACAYQTGKAQNLSAVCLEGYIVQHAGLNNVVNLQHRLLGLGAEFLRELVVQRAAYHCGDQRVIVPAADVAGFNVLTVTDNGNTVAQLEQFFQLMGYKDDADAACLQITAGLHQLLNLFLAQRGGRLVHNDHFCIDQDCLGNLDHLLNAHTEVAGRLGRIYVLTERSHNFLSLFVHGRVIQQGSLFDPLVDENVVSNAQQLLNVKLLIYARDASCRRFVRVLEMLLNAVYKDLTFVCLMYTSQHLDQRRFACAVLTDQTQDLAGLDRKLHISQSHYARKTLGRVFQFYYVFTHLFTLFFHKMKKRAHACTYARLLLRICDDRIRFSRFVSFQRSPSALLRCRQLR